MQKSDIKIGRKYWHRNRGLCVFTDPCAVIESYNPDPSSIFMEVDGELEEVSFSLIVSPSDGFIRKEDK